MYEACDYTAGTCAFHFMKLKKCNNTEIQFCVVLFLARILVVWRKYYERVMLYASLITLHITSSGHIIYSMFRFSHRGMFDLESASKNILHIVTG